MYFTNACMHDMVSIQNEYLLHFTLGNEVFNRASK